MGTTQKIPPFIWDKYITPIHKMPIFSQYETLKTVEDVQQNKFCMTTFQSIPLESEDITDIAKSFYKVMENIKELK